MLIKRTVLILCGEKSSNIGLAEYWIRLLSDYNEIIILCNNKMDFSRFKDKARVIEVKKEYSIIEGIYFGIEESYYEKILVLGIENEKVDKDFLNKLGKYDFNEEVLVTFLDGRPQPLCSVYDKKILRLLGRLIEEKKDSMTEAFDNSSVRYVFPKD